MADWRLNVAIAILAFLYASFHFSWVVLTVTLCATGLVCGVALGLLNGPPGVVRRRQTYVTTTAGDKAHAAIVRIKQYPSPVTVPLLFSRTLDSRLQEILDMTFKHHIAPFYGRFGTDSEQFYRSLQPEMWTVLAAFRDRILKMDMLQLMSQDTVQIVIDYFQYQRQFITHPSDATGVVEVDPSALPLFEPDLGQFPYLASPEAEKAFLQQVCDIVFCATLPRNVLNCSGVRSLVREFVISYLLLPSIERLCDPDFINQHLLLYLEQREKGAKKAKTKYAKAATYESFMKYLQNCRNVDELLHTRELILMDIIQARAVLKMKNDRVQTGSLRGPDIPIPAEKAEKLRSRKNLPAYINQLTNARTACEKQLRKLGGPDYVSTAHVYPSAPSASIGSRVSFDHVMANQELRSTFGKFLTTLSAAHLLECWERIEAIRELDSDAQKDALVALYDTFLASWAPKYSDVDPQLVAGCRGSLSSGAASSELLGAVVEVQKQLRLQLHVQFYNSFLTSPVYLDFKKAVPPTAPADEQQGSSTQEGPHRSADSPVFIEQGPAEEGRHEKRVRGLKQDLVDTVSSLKDIPSSAVSPAAAQRKQALEKKQKLIVSELHELENYMKRTEDWFGGMGEWCVHVAAVDITSEGGSTDPPFMLMVGQSMAALKAEDVHDTNEDFEPISLPSSDAEVSVSSDLESAPLLRDNRGKKSHSFSVDSDTSISERLSPISEISEGVSVVHDRYRDGWVIQRKLSEFKSLHTKLSQIDPSLSLPIPPRPKFSLPLVAATTKVPEEDWQKYCSQLGDYLSHVLGSETLQGCEEVFLFLSPPYQMVLKADTGDEAVKKSSLLPTYLKELLTSTKVESLVDPLFALLVEIFELGDWKMMFRKQLMDLMQFAFGADFDRQVQETIAWYVSEPMLVCYLEGARDSLWPNGAPCPNTQPRSSEEKRATRELAREKLLRNPPVLLQSILGTKNCQIGLEKIFQVLQNPKANKQLFYAMLEVLLRAVVPELEHMEEDFDGITDTLR